MNRIIVSLALLLMVQACASLVGPPPPPPLAPDEIEERLAFLRAQETRVHSFYAHGTLEARKSLSRSESNFLIAGTHAPFRIKIELTHPWGQPILHLLIDGEDVRILSPAEKKAYVGTIQDAALSKYLPGFLDKNQLWGLLMGVPSPGDYHRAASGEASRIDLFDKAGDLLQSITLDPVTRTPGQVTYPGRGITAAFSDYEEAEGILFARKIRLTDARNGVAVERRVQEMVLNRPIPEAVFTLPVPPGYRSLPLE